MKQGDAFRRFEDRSFTFWREPISGFGYLKHPFLLLQKFVVLFTNIVFKITRIELIFKWELSRSNKNISCPTCNFNGKAEKNTSIDRHITRLVHYFLWFMICCSIFAMFSITPIILTPVLAGYIFFIKVTGVLIVWDALKPNQCRCPKCRTVNVITI